jgi:hypothetical protein
MIVADGAEHAAGVVLDLGRADGRWNRSTRFLRRRTLPRTPSAVRPDSRFAVRRKRLELPGSIFRFRAFFEAIGPDARRALDEHEISPCGITELFGKSAADLDSDVDARAHARFFRDPPEFLTFMIGGTDGLHYGLWFDDPSECTGVTSYFHNMSPRMGVPAGTPLEAVRSELENRCMWVEDEDPAEREEVLTWAGGLRKRLMTVETGDRPEARPMRGDGSFYTWSEAWQTELSGASPMVDDHVRNAKERCAAGDPGHALALGRDLHWITVDDPAREQDARDLLVMAYRAMGQRYLADVAEAHYRHRELSFINALKP